MLALTLALGACASDPNEDRAVTDGADLIDNVASIVSNNDGTFNVQCKDGRTEINVPKATILANKICETPPPFVPPPTPTSWATANHVYSGDIFTLSTDGRYALVKFNFKRDEIGHVDSWFGKFNLRTYEFTQNYGTAPSYSNIAAADNRVALVWHVGKALRIELYDLGNPSVHHVFDRQPAPGQTFERDNQIRVFADGAVGWNEANVFKTVMMSGNSVTQPINGTWAHPAARNNYIGKPTRAPGEYELWGSQLCLAANPVTCVWTAPPETAWAYRSSSAKWVVYEKQGTIYRDAIAGGALSIIGPSMGSTRPAHDPNTDRLFLAHETVDINTELRVPFQGTFPGVPLAHNGHTHEVHAMPGGVTAILVEQQSGAAHAFLFDPTGATWTSPASMWIPENYPGIGLNIGKGHRWSSDGKGGFPAVTGAWLL